MLKMEEMGGFDDLKEELAPEVAVDHKCSGEESTLA